MLKSIAKNLRFTVDQILGEEGLYVLYATEAYRYNNGVKTDEVIGTRVVGVSPHLGYQKLSVTIDEEFHIDPSEIDPSSPLRATFTSFTARLYYSAEAKDYMFSCKAKEIKFLDDDARGNK